MQKASRIVLLVLTFLVITAATNNADAQSLTNVDLQSVNLSSSKFISTSKKKATPAKPKSEARKPIPTQTFASSTQVLAANIQIQPQATSTPAPTTTSA